MNFAMNLEPHIAALLFLGSGALLVLLTLATLVLFFWRRRWLRYSLRAIAARFSVTAYCCWRSRLFSHERTLALGQEKYFCELTATLPTPFRTCSG